ncbi:hypothetical protein RB601_008165 [Gaeumannomyces tritici]
MLAIFSSRRRPSAGVTLLALAATLLTLLVSPAAAATKIRNGADPTIMKIGDTYYSAESAGGGIHVRRAKSLLGLGASDVDRKRVWADSAGLGDVWAPEIAVGGDDGRTYIYFSAGQSAAHRMYAIAADEPYGDYTPATKVALPDDQWAIDGAPFTFEGQRYFVWSGWRDSTTGGVEQNLYICRMASATRSTGARFIISQPREPWEQGSGRPLINEGPQPIVDPNGQLHVAYSANGSWESKYCVADLRLRKGGDPTYVWDWYKSNGCLFGSRQVDMMQGWDATLQVDGPGHHTWVLDGGVVGNGTIPNSGNRKEFVFHGVPKGTPYSWDNRQWFTGSYVWWGPQIAYSRANVPGDNVNKGWSFKFFE